MALKSPWSHSSLKAFETCPHRYYVTKVTKQVKEPQGEAQKWGDYVHKAFEDRIKEGTPLPGVMAPYEGMVDSLFNKADVVISEQELAVNSSYEPTGWWDKDAWSRSIIDVTVIKGDKAIVLDWKTGKREPPPDQLMLFAGQIFSHYPQVEQVMTGFVKLMFNKITKDLFTRSQVPEIWGAFIPRVARLEIAYDKNKWPKKPSGLCRSWCPVGKALCEHCGS